MEEIDQIPARGLVERRLKARHRIADAVADPPEQGAVEMVADVLGSEIRRWLHEILSGGTVAATLDGARLNDLNKALLEAIQLGGQAFLSSTMLEDRFVLRACIVNPRSRPADLDLLVDLVQTTGARLANER